MRTRILFALLLLTLGAVTYEVATTDKVQVTDDGTPPPPTWP